MMKPGDEATCIGCGITFRLKNHWRMCVQCRREHDRQWRLRRKAEGRPVVSTQMPADWQREYEKSYLDRPGVRRRIADRAKERIKNPSERPKCEARWKVQRAVASGKIKRQPCEVCGAHDVQAHHDDYSRPLDVRWLCPKHHREHHRQAGAA